MIPLPHLLTNSLRPFVLDRGDSWEECWGIPLAKNEEGRQALVLCFFGDWKLLAVVRMRGTELPEFVRFAKTWPKGWERI